MDTEHATTSNVLQAIDKTLFDISVMALAGHGTDGGHHKQWCLEQILDLLGKPVPQEDRDGIA